VPIQTAPAAGARDVADGPAIAAQRAHAPLRSCQRAAPSTSAQATSPSIATAVTVRPASASIARDRSPASSQSPAPVPTSTLRSMIE